MSDKSHSFPNSYIPPLALSKNDIVAADDARCKLLRGLLTELGESITRKVLSRREGASRVVAAAKGACAGSVTQSVLLHTFYQPVAWQAAVGARLAAPGTLTGRLGHATGSGEARKLSFG